MRTSRVFFASVSIVLLLSACSLNAAAGETNSPAAPSVPPADSVSPSLALTIASSATPTTQDTPTNTATVAPAGLNAAGPYAVFAGEAGIWITNPDGSFPTRISEQGIVNGSQGLRDSLSPRGDAIAMTVRDKTGVDLVVVDIPGGQARTISRLIAITRNELDLNSMSLEAFAYYAITDFPDLAWQPGEGDVLAYIGAGNGDSATADVYTFDFAWEKTRHIEEDPSQAISPIWSPGGEYLLYFGVEWLPPFGPARITFEPMKGFWAVQAADNLILPQRNLKGTYRNFVGWQDDTHYLVFDSDEECFAHNLRAVDLLTGGESPVAEFCMYTQPVWSPSNGAVLLSVDAGCECGIGEGVYLILPGLTEPLRLSDRKAFELSWLPESSVFYAYPEGLFSADGSVHYDPPVIGSSYRPAVSQSGNQAWVVIEDHRARVMVRPRDGSWLNILDGNASAMLWDPISGETLLIVLDTGGLYSATAPDFTPRRMGDLEGLYDQAAWTLVSEQETGAA